VDSFYRFQRQNSEGRSCRKVLFRRRPCKVKMGYGGGRGGLEQGKHFVFD